MYDPRFTDEVRRLAGMKPATVKEHDQAAAAAHLREAAQRRRAEQIAERRVARACAKVGVPNPLACAAGRPDSAIDRRIRDGIRHVVGSAAGPLGEALETVTVETDPEVKALWPGVRSHLIKAGRKMVADDPKIDAAALRRYYQDIVAKVWRALGIDGLDLAKEVEALVDLALVVAPAVSKQPITASSKPKADPLRITWPSTSTVAASRGVALFTSH